MKLINKNVGSDIACYFVRGVVGPNKSYLFGTKELLLV